MFSKSPIANINTQSNINPYKPWWIRSSISGEEKVSLEETWQVINNNEVCREKLDLGWGLCGGGQDSLHCPCSSHCFKLSPWSSSAFLGTPHIHSSTPHFTSSRGKTSQMCQVSELLDSAWQLCAVGHSSHSPHAAPEHVRQAGAKLNVEITEKISRLVVKEGRQVACWFLGDFRLCMWLVLSFWHTSQSTWKAHTLSQLSGEPRKDCLEFWTTHNGHTLNPSIMQTHSVFKTRNAIHVTAVN